MCVLNYKMEEKYMYFKSCSSFWKMGKENFRVRTSEIPHSNYHFTNRETYSKKLPCIGTWIH